LENIRRRRILRRYLLKKMTGIRDDSMMTEPTKLKLADLTVEELRSMLAAELSGMIDRMIANGNQISTQYLAQQIKSLELRTEVDKLKGNTDD
jgi:hypothetical protein